MGPGPWRTGPEYQTAAFSHSRRVSSRLTHSEPYFARSLVRPRTITWGLLVRSNTTRRGETRRDAIRCNAMRFSSPARLAIEILWVLNARAMHFVRCRRICPSETTTPGTPGKIMQDRDRDFRNDNRNHERDLFFFLQLLKKNINLLQRPLSC